MASNASANGLHPMCAACGQPARLLPTDAGIVPLCTTEGCRHAVAMGRTFTVAPALPVDGKIPDCEECRYPTLAHRSTCSQAPLTGLDARSPALARLHQAAVLERIGRELLGALGYDLTDASLKETPRRWAKWWQEFTSYQDPNTETAFDSVTADQMVVVRGVRVWSLCEHHLLPFWCDVTMAYIPAGRILGLSKFGRIAHLYAHRLQVQERLTGQIADHLERVTGSADVAVIGSGEHLCMTMRGIRAPARMQSSVLRGAFRDGPVRQEFFHLASQAAA